MNYLRNAIEGFNNTRQTEAIPGTEQVQNSAGGYSFEVDDFARLRRFLVLGSEGGSYYASQRDLTKSNTDSLLRAIRTDGQRVVQEVAEISSEGRAPKNDPAIYVLALCSTPKFADLDTRRAALNALPEVCRTGTHLFTFVEFVNEMRGWGRQLREGVGAWYESKDADALAYQGIKYRQRNGWTHRDVLRLCHAGKDEIFDAPKRTVYDFLTGKLEHNPDLAGAVPNSIYGYLAAQESLSADQTAALVAEYGLPREALKTEHLTEPVVWEALLTAGRHGMPITALIRNLANMTRIGLLTPGSSATRTVVEALRNQEKINAGRVHPIQIIQALLTYKAGVGQRGTTWTPNTQIIDALDDAFYLAFGNVRSTGARRLLALDVSGSMQMGRIGGVAGFTPAIAAGVMSMVSAASGDPYEVVAFTAKGHAGSFYRRDSELTHLDISPRQRLDDITRTMHEAGRQWGGTDCALPMLYANEKNLEFDIFEVYTDNETWAGNIHPSQAIQKYRQSSGINARLAVVGLVANNFSIADPNDAGMLDVVGFDTAAPNIISDFAAGLI